MNQNPHKYVTSHDVLDLAAIISLASTSPSCLFHLYSQFLLEFLLETKKQRPLSKCILEDILIFYIYTKNTTMIYTDVAPMQR